MGCTTSKTIQDELRLTDISIIPKFTFNNLETFAKVIDVYDGDRCTVLMKINNNINTYNIRIFGYNAPSLKSKGSSRQISTNGINAKLLLINLITSCGNLIDETTSIRKTTHIIKDNNVKIVKIKLLDFDKYDRIFARIYLDEQNKFVDEIMIESSLVYPYQDHIVVS
jgi:endonuclease YncB( thermonuclease family)